jgi:hypothetical protein
MHLTKYTEGWTRRHFLEQISKGVFAAGNLPRPPYKITLYLVGASAPDVAISRYLA